MKNKKQRKQDRQKQQSTQKSNSLQQWWTNRLPVSQPVVLALLFCIAFTIRLIALLQYQSAPNFNFPSGDAATYTNQAFAILQTGKLFPDKVLFQTPLYPIFQAIMLAIGSRDLFFVRLIQIIIGSISCLLMYGVSKKLFPKNQLIPIVAGLLMAGYGTFIFYDLDLLATNLTLFFLLATVLVLLQYNDSKKQSWLIQGGLYLGCAVVLRSNLLLMLPIMLWFVINQLQFKWKGAILKPALVFLLATGFMIVPVTIHNYLVEKDVVLISSNAGINLFIGNHEHANGTFTIPQVDGLSDYDFEQSQKETAERLAGKTLKPSQVSRYWSKQAWKYLFSNPWAVPGLYIKKMKVLLNYQEFPNHLNMEYYKTYHIPLLKVTLIGWSLIFTLAGLGLVMCWIHNRFKPGPVKLVVILMLVYLIGLLPFFMNARYRLPLALLLLPFSAYGGWQLIQMVLEKKWKAFLGYVVIGCVLILLTQLPTGRISFAHARSIAGDKYIERAEQQSPVNYQDINAAILEYKQAIETNPGYPTPYFRLSIVYEKMGYFTGNIQMLEKGLKIQPNHPQGWNRLAEMKERIKQESNRTTEATLPKTPFEQGVIAEEQDRQGEAKKLYVKILEKDPYHIEAYLRLARLFESEGKMDQAIKVIEKSYRYNQQISILQKELLYLYKQTGKHKKAERFQKKVSKRKFVW